MVVLANCSVLEFNMGKLNWFLKHFKFIPDFCLNQFALGCCFWTDLPLDCYIDPSAEFANSEFACPGH